MTATKRQYGVERIAVSGGECTLNRPWLIQYLNLLKEQNPESRLHVDTNGSILTKDYLEDLVEAGMTDIGIDLKAIRTTTFQEITGLLDEDLVLKYMESAWQATRYLHDTHPEVFMGIGIPYNSELISIDEIREMGEKIAEIDPWMQVCALDYRPEFKRLDLVKPSFWEMMQVHGILRDCGLESVICQTERGKIGPTGRLLT
jgi:pyruvate formate lyase activating enzyme